MTSLLAKCSLYLHQVSVSKRGYYSFYFHRTYISIGLYIQVIFTAPTLELVSQMQLSLQLMETSSVQLYQCNQLKNLISNARFHWVVLVVLS